MAFILTLNEWIKNYRTQHGLSMQAFADMCGFSKAYISILENGINPTTKKPVSPTVQTLKKIAEGTGQDVNEFIAKLDGSQSVTVSLTEQITLSSHESNIIKKYRALDERGKQAVDDTLEREYEFVKPKAEESAIS